MEYKVSVIIPIYNMEQVVSRCLNSVQNQTLDGIEIICIDDGSTDKTIEEIQKYQKKNANIKLLRQLHEGAGRARNNGIRTAKGKYIFFLDADDLYPNNDVLSQLYEIAEREKALVCGGSFSNLVEGKTNTIYKGYRAGCSFAEDGWISYSDYQFAYAFYRFLYNRKMLIDNHIYFPAYTRMEDPVFFVKAMICAKRMYTIAEITYCAIAMDKKIDYSSSNNIKGILCGFKDVFQMAIDNKLDRLYKAMLEEFFEKYEPRVYASVFRGIDLKNEIEAFNEVVEHGHNTWKDVLYKKIATEDEMKVEIERYEQEMKIFDKEIEGWNDVIIYGAGVVGKEVFDYLDSRMKNVPITFVVSKTGNLGKVTARGNEVIEIGDIRDISNRNIIVAISGENEQKKIKKELEHKGVKNIVLVNPRALHFFV